MTIGKGDEGPRGPRLPAKLELSLAVGSTRIKDSDNGHEEKEGEEEVEVIDVCASLVLGQRRQLWISRGALRGRFVKRSDQGSAAFFFGQCRRFISVLAWRLISLMQVSSVASHSPARKHIDDALRDLGMGRFFFR